MAGKLIIDTIQTEASFLQLNVASNLIATMNANGIYSTTGTKMIGTDGSVGAATIANTAITGVITATQMAANSVNATILQTNSIENYMATSGRPLSNRNLVINGAMQVAQRNTSVTGITSSNYYTADRWVIGIGSAGTWTMNVESSAPTGTEFRKSANVICTTSDSSLSASDNFTFSQRIEGQNLQGLKKGTANAESLTISFYVKSSNTGTYICEFRDIDNTRQISKSYTINAANTWEKKTLTFPPDTTGQLDNDNAESLRLQFWLAAGSDFTSGALNSSAWASETNANRAVGQLNLANATGNYWAVTGVQLETGTVATPYEWLDYGTELLKCQRYYYRITPEATGRAMGLGYSISATEVLGIVNFPTTMRVSPTGLEQSGTVADYTILNATGNAVNCSGVPTFSQGYPWGSRVTFVVASGLTAGQGANIRAGSTSGFLGWSAEL